MHFLSGLPVKRKLTRVLALNAGIALALSAAGIVPYEYYHARRDAQRDLETAADMIGTNSAAPIIFRDLRSAEKTLQALQADPRIVATLGREDASGSAGGSAHRSHDSSRCDRRGIRPNLSDGGDETRFVRWPEAFFASQDENLLEHQGSLFLAREIEVDDERIGRILRIQADLGDLQSRLRLFAVLLLLAGALSMLVAHQISPKLGCKLSSPTRSPAWRTRLVGFATGRTIPSVPKRPTRTRSAISSTLSTRCSGRSRIGITISRSRSNTARRKRKGPNKPRGSKASSSPT